MTTPVFHPPRVWFNDAPDDLCDCCWHTFREGQRIRSAVAYNWQTKVGNVFRLCVNCCAEWRKNTLDDADLVPARVSSLDHQEPR